MSQSRSTRPAVTLLCIVSTIGLVSVALTLFWARSENLLAVGVVSSGFNDLQEELVSSEPFTEPPMPPVPPVSPVPPMLAVPAETTETATVPPPDPWKTQVLQWVNGEPTDNFQDNLRQDMQYVTTWISGGWTNDFMTYINMIYLGLLTGRTPILPPFAPSHVSRDAGFPPFGDVFDIPYLSAAIKSPLLEWRDVKKEDSAETDALGCWSVWSLVGTDKGEPRGSSIPYQLNLDISYTALPLRTERMAGQTSGPWMPFSSLADLSLPSRRAQALSQHPAHTGSLEPDARLMCFDFMYYMGSVRHDEWWADWSPAWRIVGRHARWAPQLEHLAQGYVRRALGLGDNGEDYPPYIGVHVRRGDFTATCGGVPKEECFQPLAVYARRVLEVRGALLAQRGIDVPAEHVLVTSDEKDEQWWAEVTALGWRRVDHVRERTEERLGKWFAPLIDAVVQSRGVGFVGTDRSTMSLVARRRVEDWQGGIGYLVHIGRKGADD